jgi:hypothetical protein
MSVAKPIRPSRKARGRIEAAARAVGCTCKQPDVRLVAWHSDTVQNVQMAHDPGCPALETGRTAVLLSKAGS